MMLLLPLPLIQLIASINGARGYTSVGQQQQQQRAAAWTSSLSSPSHPQAPRKQLTVAAAFANTHSAARSSVVLNAGLRDLVGPDDYDEYGPPGQQPNIAPSIREERNSVFDVFGNGRNNNNNDRGSAFGSGGFGSGGNGGDGIPGGGRRNSPGFTGFTRDGFSRDRSSGRRDGNYPNYDVVIDTPLRGSGTRNARIFDNVDFDDLPGSSTRSIGNNGPYGNDPYDRGLNSDFINTNGSNRGTTRSINNGPRGNANIRNNNNSINNGQRGNNIRGNNIIRNNDFDGDRSFSNLNRRGGRADVPQIYRRDLYDNSGGRSFNSLTPVEQYFEAWNRRNIPLALSCFDDNIYYDDTQFSEPFEGKDKLANHLLYVADCLPASFYFVVDELSVGQSVGGRRRDRPASPTFQLGRNRVAQATRRASNAPTTSIGAMWHIENEFGSLPFARGCSFFKVDPNSNLIVEAYDFPEPAVKAGASSLKLLSVASKLVSEPKRWLPFFAWIAYVYIVYFSNGILPGKDIFHADAKTWTEVQDLTFNFMFIAPATHMPTAVKLNPVLEGIFNGLLAWSFMFAGFLSDERSGMGPYGKDSRYYERMVQNQEQVLDNGIVLVPPVSITKKNLIPLVPTIVWMQFFWVAFLLPYLFARTSERYSSEIQSFDDDGRGQQQRNMPRRIRPLYREELDRPALVLGESKILGVILGAIGIFALYWGFAGRPEDFGPPIWVSDKRMVEFMKLLDKDRVAAGFVIDLWVFGIFQGWLVDDDWKRRGRSMEEEKFLRNVAKFVPFFGLASYLVFRPKYPSSKDEFDYESFFNSRGSSRGGLSRRDDGDDRGGRSGGGGDRFRNRN